MKYNHRTTHPTRKAAIRKLLMQTILMMVVLTIAYYLLLNWVVLAVIYLSQFVSLLWEIIL